MINWKIGDRVNSINDGEVMAQGTVIGLNSKGGPIVEADYNEGIYQYDKNGKHEIHSDFSVEKIDNNLN